MGKDDKLIKIAKFNTSLNKFLGTKIDASDIYRSKGLLAHMLNRKHYVAAKYIDFLPDIVEHPDYAGFYNGNIELVKCYKENIFVCIKLDNKKGYYYVATMFEVKKSKINTYVNSGRLKAID
jgi:hypothetical protein